MTEATSRPDREQIERFVRTVLSDAPPNSFIALRSFYDDSGDGPPFQSKFVRIEDDGDLENLVDVAFKMGKAAADCARPVVLCAPLATFTRRTAKTNDLAAGLALTVECDSRAAEAKRVLEAVLGPPSLTVASGGVWTNPDTGACEDKLHLHWALREPAYSPEDQAALAKLRSLACELVGADATSKAIVHPLRLPGSVHRKKEPRLCRILESSDLRIDLHEALAELEGLAALRTCVGPDDQVARQGSAADRKPLAPDLLEGCADRIPNDDLGWAEWNRLGMAFWRASGGAAEGFVVFDAWSSKSRKYDADVTAARWKHYATSPPSRIGAGTLVFLAREADPEFQRHRSQGSASSKQDGETGQALAPLHEAIREVNGKFFVVQVGGSVVIGCYQRDATLERETLYFVKSSDLVLKYKSRKYLVGYTPNGREIWKSLGEAWLESPLRREYDRAEMACSGQCPPDMLNLWRGWGCIPREGSWQTIAEHILYVICGGNEDSYEYLIRLLAWWVQHPAAPGEVAIVLRGKKGAGKGALAQILMRWFRHHAVHISQPRHLTGHFNAHLADCLFLFADEVVWGGDRLAEGALKALVTERAVHIEPKGVNAFQVPNRLKILMASNADWAVPVTADERRYLVLDVSAVRIGDRGYFEQLHAAIAGTEAEAMLLDLLRIDLAGFDHRSVPHTDGLNAQKMEGLDSVGRWWASCLEAERIAGDDINNDYWPAVIRKRDLHAAYIRHAHDHGERHPKFEATFAKRFKELAPTAKSTRPHGKPREWTLQTLEAHRAEFLEVMKIDRWDWHDDEADIAAGNMTPLRRSP